MQMKNIYYVMIDHNRRLYCFYVFFLEFLRLDSFGFFSLESKNAHVFIVFCNFVLKSCKK